VFISSKSVRRIALGVCLGVVAGGADLRAQGAIRNLPDRYEAGATVTVTISIEPPDGTTVVGLEESLPGGWTGVKGITDNGQNDTDNHKVKWGPFFAPAVPSEVSYQLVAPIAPGESACFSGTASFDGFNETVGGDDCIVEGPGAISTFIEVIPEAPRETDEIVVRVFGGGPNSCFRGCEAEGMWFDTNQYHVDAYVGYYAPPGKICLPMITPFAFEFPVGLLSVGEYIATTEAIAIDSSGSFECGPGELLDKDEDQVTFYVHATADLDLDRDVDLRDVADFKTCLSESWDRSAPAANCLSSDFDEDGDIDLDDFSEFPYALTGP